MRIAFVCLAVLIGARVAAAGDPVDVESLLRGGEFVRGLDQPLRIDREQVPLRELLERLQSERHIAIVLDRRVDPGRVVDARLPAMSLRGALEDVSRRADCVLRIIGDTVIIGPEDNTGLLRTICALRELEFEAFGPSTGGGRSLLTRADTLSWDDLERPVDFVRRVADRAHVQVTGTELVPHDLWAQGIVVEMTAVEALSWVLAQYNLAFEWTDAGKGVRIVPLSGVIAITREHPVRRITPLEALQRVGDRFPDLEARLEGNKLTATGLIEQHEVIAVLARGDDPDAPARQVRFGSLDKRRFTLRVVRQPAAAVLATLQKNEVDLRIDQAALTAANVDLQLKISLEVKQATISELLTAICEPLGTTFTVAGETVFIPSPTPAPDVAP